MKMSCPYTATLQANDPCVANEVVSLLRRHLTTAELDRTQLQAEAVENAFKLLREHYPPTLLTPMTLEQVIKHKPPSMRKKYINAANELKERGLLEPWDVKISAFIKNEKMSFPNDDIKADILKPPRMIQARSQKFNLVMQRFLIPYAKLWKSRHYTLKNGTPFLKGFNTKQIADILRADWKHFSKPIAILLDHEAYDAKVNSDWTAAEHSYYKAHYPGHPDLNTCCKALCKSKGKTAGSVKYKVIATRCSGDPTTADGNSTDNLALLLDLTEGIYCIPRVIGDDSVLTMEESDYNNHMKQRLKWLGIRYPWKTKHEVVYQFERVEFCQSRPVKTVNGWLMVRKPYRMLTRSLTCVNQKVTTVPLFLRWLTGVGMSEVASNPGVPIHQAFGNWASQASAAKPIFDDHYDKCYRCLRGVYSHDIPLATRLSYEKAFGIPPWLQLKVERYFQHYPTRMEILTSPPPYGDMVGVWTA